MQYKRTLIYNWKHKKKRNGTVVIQRMNERTLQPNEYYLFPFCTLERITKYVQQLDYKNMVHFGYCVLHLENWILYCRHHRRRRVWAWGEIWFFSSNDPSKMNLNENNCTKITAFHPKYCEIVQLTNAVCVHMKFLQLNELITQMHSGIWQFLLSTLFNGFI